MKTNKNALKYFDLVKLACDDKHAGIISNKDIAKIKPDTQFKEDLDLNSLDIAELLVNLSDQLHVDLDIDLSKIRTFGDVCMLIHEKFYKHNAIKNHVFKFLISDMAAITPNADLDISKINFDTQIKDVMKFNGYNWYFQHDNLTETISKKYKVYIIYDISRIKTLGELCDIIAKEIISVQKMRQNVVVKKAKSNVTANAYTNARSQIMNEIAEDLVKTDWIATLKPENVQYDSNLHFNSVYDYAELSLLLNKKYNINAKEDVLHVKNVGDLCDNIIKMRLKQFQSLKYKTK